MLRGQRAGWREGSERTDGSSTRYRGRVRIQLSANPVPNTLKTDSSNAPKRPQEQKCTAKNGDSQQAENDYCHS